MAAAMLAMVCNLTVGRPRFADVEPEAQAILSAALEEQHQLVALADADAEAYLAVRDAYRLPRATEAEQSARTGRIEESIHQATETPVQTAEAARRLLDLAARAAQVTNPTALGDVAVATHLALAATRGAAEQARLNLLSLTDAAFVSQVRARIQRITAEAENVAGEALHAIDTRAGGG